MPTGISAFRNLILSSMERVEQLERTPEGRRKLIADYTAEAKRLRGTSGTDLHSAAGGEMNTHVASPAELHRRALERADSLDAQVRRLRAIRGIYEPYMRYMAGM